jgi:hypothetical protein
MQERNTAKRTNTLERSINNSLSQQAEVLFKAVENLPG